MSRLRFNHAYTIAFEVLSDDENGEDVSAAKLRRALRKRLRELNDKEMIEACGAPFDTMPRDA